jgi:NAD+ kinase
MTEIRAGWQVVLPLSDKNTMIWPWFVGDLTNLRHQGQVSMNIHFSASEHDEAKTRLKQLTDRYGQTDLPNATHIVALGGDGHMLHVLQDTMSFDLPVFGMNCGRLGFLMNHYDAEDLPSRIEAAEIAPLHPLRMTATDRNNAVHNNLAINEVSVLRQTHNAAHIGISIDQKQQMDCLVCDGVLVATPAGSTAYNLSAHGPVVPLGGGLLALTPISPFRPRRWRGALLSDSSKVILDILEAGFRPVSASADSAEVRHVTSVLIEQASEITINLLYDPGFSLSDRAVQEQFLS